MSLCHHGSIGCHCFHTDCTDLTSISLCHWSKWMFSPECVTVSPWQYWLSLFSHRLHRSDQHFTLPLVEMDAFTPSVSLCHHGSIGCHCFHRDCTDLTSISLCHWSKWMFSPECVTVSPWQYWLSLFSHRLHRSDQHFTLPLVEIDAFTPSVSLCHHGSIGCHCFHTDCTDLTSISLCHWLK